MHREGLFGARISWLHLSMYPPTELIVSVRKEVSPRLSMGDQR